MGVQKGVNGIIDDGTLRWYGHVKRMDEGRLVKRIYDSMCVGERRVGRPRKRWSDNVRGVLREKGVDEGQMEGMVYDRNVWRGFVRERAWGAEPGDEL